MSQIDSRAGRMAQLVVEGTAGGEARFFVPGAVAVLLKAAKRPKAGI